MGVLITQYKKNGGTLLNHMAEKRENDKSRIAGNIEQQKKELLCVYGEAQDFINDAEKKIKSSTLSKFEKQWRKEQEDIRRRIDDGRKMVT
jgi:hypothetical protein